MKNASIKLALFLNYFVFAILLNSVGTVILQVQRNFDITKSNASILEGFKDITIAVSSFVLASFLPKIGLKKSMLIGLALVIIFCAITPTIAHTFWYFKVLFFVIGFSFALIKVSVFSTIGLITANEKEHGSFMGFLEAMFMAGILLGMFSFSYFIDDKEAKSLEWLNFYYILATLSAGAFLLLLSAKLDESAAKIESRPLEEDFAEMFKMMLIPLVIVFIISAFLYVLIEQSFQTWFPTFYNDILHSPASMGIQAGAILAGANMIGRLASGFILQRIRWIYWLSICLISLSVIVLVAIPLAQNVAMSTNTTWFNAPFVVYLMPLLGFFLAPIYPTLNSTILSSLPKHTHSSMSGLIVVFSAIGGTTGSMITGSIFEAYSGTTAFYFSLIPITLILICIWILYKMITQKAKKSIQ